MRPVSLGYTRTQLGLSANTQIRNTVGHRPNTMNTLAHRWGR
jgi:hypothetical protein